MLRMITNILRKDGTCKRVSAFLLDYVEGRLEPKTAERFDNHISSCPNCKLYLDQYRETMSLVKDIPDPPVPAELEERVSAFLKSALSDDPNQES